ncbi:MAG: hypothetical protein L0Z62_15660 [Gemmataceae bacterium]|nr:hypothetical protein [Gemmataceae bacterium]
MPGRRFALYFAWSRPQEVGALLGTLENRYPTLFEFRRALWPHYEHASDPTLYLQDISGFLDHVILFDFQRFTQVVAAVTGQRVQLVQRQVDPARHQPLDAALLRDVDTLIVISLDHVRTDQQASAEEVGTIQQFLQREGTCLVVCPHHDVGATGSDLERRRVEFEHHGDRLVPAQQRIGGFARSLLQKLGLPVENRFGLSPARSAADNGPALLEVNRDLDRHRVLEGVRTFNLHPHLPHLHVPPALAGVVHVLARQPVNPAATGHPFVEEGNRYFNALLWVPPGEGRAGHVLICDATLWSAAFGGLESLENFWRNLTRLK